MTRVGLTGGYACGKSFVGSILASFGGHLIRADDLGHQVLAPGGEAYEPTIAEFGRGILSEDGAIDRKRLAAEVFNNPERLAALNAIVHPAVIRREEAWIAELAARDPNAIAVVEAAILIETGSHVRFDSLIVVVCTEEQQIERATKRDGCTRAEVEARLRRQMPLEEKRKYADYVIDTSGSKERTIEQTRQVFEKLRSKRK